MHGLNIDVHISSLSSPALVICYAIDHLALSYFCKVVTRDGDPEDGHETTEGNEDAKSFIPLAALSSLWLPSVVGPQHSRIFLVSGIASLVTKVLLLVAAVALAEAGLLTSVHPKPFLLFCFDEYPPHLNESITTPCRFSEHNVSEKKGDACIHDACIHDACIHYACIHDP